MIYGYSGKILRVDLTSGHVSTESLSDEQARNYIGGRGFNMRSLYDEIPPFLDGLDPRNKLFIGTSPLVGTMIPGAARFNVSAKSPQTGILGDSNSGGFFAPELKFAGYDQIILEGKAPKPVYLLINNEGVQLRSAENLWGLDIWSCQRMLQAELGDSRVQFLIAGPAAENGVKFAGLFNNLARAAARTASRGPC
jgi:aldehyde:ferredoxin oxidoreductase